MSLRVDAARNQRAIVDAAREVFAEQGLDAPLDVIARRAGTGNATLYRRFPTRCDLVAAVFADRMAEHVAAVEAGLAEQDAWKGFCSYVTAIAAMQARDRGIADLVTMDLSSAPEIERLRTRAFTCMVELMNRAKDAGSLRADVTPEDILLLLMANAGLVERSDRAGAQASDRLVHLLLDGLSRRGATRGPSPPSARQMNAALRANRARHRLDHQLPGA
jgi:AcrR family transcriptional regulator